MAAHATSGGGSVLDRWRRAIGADDDEREADELRAEAQAAGATCIDKISDRQMADVVGVVRCVTLPPRASIPMFVVELFDGTCALNLVWLGRRQVRGLDPGVKIRAKGRVTRVHGTPTIYNPSYEIVPERGV